MPVGNDVVDLQDPANQPSAIHPRFDERVFSNAELDRLGALDALDGHRLRWTLWAARESVYKHLAQAEPGAPFRPAEMTVRLAGRVPGRPSGRVEWNDHVVRIRADCRTDRVHVVTLGDSGIQPVCTVRRIGNVGIDTASAAGRRLAAETVARTLDRAPGDLRIVTPPTTAPDRAPRALHRGDVLPVDLSISHDGDWIACAVSPVRARVSLRRDPAEAR